MSPKLLLLPFVALVLQAQVQVPQLGSVRCGDGSVRPVYGVPAVFVLGKPLLTDAVSASFSEKGGIVATIDTVRLIDASGRTLNDVKTMDPGAVVGIYLDLTSALAWLPASSSLLYWQDEAFHLTTLPFPLIGQVTSVYREGSQAVLLVTENNHSVSRNEVSLSSGEITSVRLLPNVTGPAFSTGSYLLSGTETGIEIEGPDGHASLPLPVRELVMEQMTTGWIRIGSLKSARSWALHLKPGVVEVYELPAVAPIGVRK